VRPERIRITIPDANGHSFVHGLAGALPSGAQAVAVRRSRDFIVRYQATVAADGSFSFPLGHEHASDSISTNDLIDLQVLDAVSRGIIAVVELTPFASEDRRSFIAPVGRDTLFLSADGIRVRVPAGAFDVPTLIAVTPATQTPFADVPKFDVELGFGTAVELRFDGIARKRIDLDLPIPAALTTTGRTWYAGYLGQSIRGPRVMIVDLAFAKDGRFLTGVPPAGSSGARGISTHALTGALTGPELRDYFLGVNRSGIFALVDFGAAAGPVGFGILSGIQAGHDLFWSTLESLYASHFYLLEGRGRIAIPVVLGKQFQVVGVDASTGLEAFSKVYDPIPIGDPGSTVITLPTPSPDTQGPYPILGSPFRVETLDLDVEDVVLNAIRDFTVTLRSNGKVVAETTLPAAINISLMNVTRGRVDPSRAGGLEVPGELGDRIVLLIGAVDVDPFSAFSIVLSEPIEAGADPMQFFKITLDGQPITLKARVDSERRVVFESPASLKRGGKYRLEISPDLTDKAGLRIGQVLDATGNPSPPLIEPLYLDFEVREPHGKVGSFDLASGVIRDMALTNNILLISAQEGGIVAYDVANPAGITTTSEPIGHHQGGITSYWALATDHHGRVYATGMTPMMGVVRSFRIEDFTKGNLDVQHRGAGTVSFVPGAAAAMNIASRIIASDRPEAIPRKLQVLVQDREVAYEDREELKDAGAVVTKVTGDLEELRLEVPFHPGNPYAVQRVTVENLSIDMRWSADAIFGQPARIERITGRANDRFRVIYNEATYGVVSLLGYGIAVIDLNAIESNDAPVKKPDYNETRELVRLTSGRMPRQCGTLPQVAIPDLSFIPDAAIRTAPGSSEIQVFGLDPHRGVLDLVVQPPEDTYESAQPPDAVKCEERMSPSGLVFRDAIQGYDHSRLRKLRELYEARTGRAPFGRFNAAAPYTWRLEAKDNHVVTPATLPGIFDLGQRGSFPNEAVTREYVLVPANEYGLLVVEIGGDAPMAPGIPGAPPLAEDHLVDVIWIPHGAYAVRTFPRTKLAVVTDGEGHVLLVDLTRIDDRWTASGAIPPDELFPTVRAILEEDANTPDPRIVWRSAEPLASGTLAPVLDTDTGNVYAGKLLEKTTNVVSAIDPRIVMKADIGAAGGFSEIGGPVSLGLEPPPNIKLIGANASLSAFRFEVALPGGMDESLTGETFFLDVESERVFGAKTEDTDEGMPRAHLRIPMQRNVPASMTHLRFQHGYNQWVSPWIIPIADVRASEKWPWPAGTTAAQKAEQGCANCERPPALKGKPEPEVFELYTAGRLIVVRPTSSAFSGTPYEYLIQGNRLEMRAPVVPADTLRPREVQIAAQNPPIAEGALQGTTFVHSGEIGTSDIDLDAGGRAGLSAIADRTYLSRTIGGTAFGAGWDSMLFRRLRPLPNGNVEYRDGRGEVWLFRLTYGDYESPRGVFLKLGRTENGWMLVDQQWRQTHFDVHGRLTAETDLFYDGKRAGSITRYLYDAIGRLGRVIDPVARETSITYNATGQVDQVTDWRGRKVNYFYNAGRLVRVELPEAKAADGVPPEFNHTGANRPRMAYTYDDAASSATLSDALQLKTNLKTIKDPAGVASGGPALLTFDYTADRVTQQQWATSETATFDYAGAATTVIDALGQRRVYTLTDSNANDRRAHIASMSADQVPVLQFTISVPAIASPTMTPAPQSLTWTATYTDDGQILKVKQPNQLEIESTYKEAVGGAPGTVLMKTRETGPSFAGSETHYTREASANLVEKIGRTEGGGELKQRDTPQPTRGTKPTVVTDDGVSVFTTYNDAGQVLTVVQKKVGSATPAMTSETKYYETAGPRLSRGLPRVTSGGDGLREHSFEYFLVTNGGERVEVTDELRDTKTESTFDSFGRKVRELARDSNATVLGDERFGYDASGRLAYHVRTQSGVGNVETRIKYDALGREIETSTTHAAVEGSPSTIKATASYDLANRRITVTDPTSGASDVATQVTTLDGMGRVGSVERRGGATSQTVMQRYGHDAMGRLSFESDGVRVARVHQRDLLGRTLAVIGSDGTKVETTYGPWGEPDLITGRDANSTTVAQRKTFFTDQGRLRSTNEATGSVARKTHLQLLEGGKITVVRVGEVPSVDSVDLGTGTHRARQTVRDIAGNLIDERIREIGPTFDPDPLSTTGTWARTQTTYIGGVPVGIVASEPIVSADYATTIDYDGLDRPVQQTLAGAYTTSTTFDEASNVVSVTRPGMDAETASYDSRGLVTKSTFPDGKTNEVRYDALGNVIEMIDEAGQSTFYDYDPLGRSAKVRYADGTSEESTYEDLTGAIKATRDRAGQWLSYSYDSGGRTIGLHDGADPSAAPLLVKYEYDAAGRLRLVRNKDAGIGYDDYDLLRRPGTTRAYRYRASSGLDPSPIPLDEHTQRHTWSIHDGERSSWRMPAVGASVPADLPGAKWLDTIVETRDTGSNLITQSKKGGAILTSADPRSAGRIAVRRRHLQSGSTIASSYGFADGKPLLGSIELPPLAVGATIPTSGLPFWSETSVGSVQVAGSANLRDDALRLSSLLELGTQRLSAWDYDDRGRLTDTWLSLTATSGTAPVRDEYIDADFRAKRQAKPSLTVAQHTLLGAEAAKIEPLTWTATSTDTHGIDDRTLSLDGVDLAARDYTFAGARRTSDGVWTYTFDKLGRVTSASTAERRIELTWDPNDRLVGRAAYEPDSPSGWKLETRTNVLARDGLPSQSTFIWDPIVDRLVAIYVQGASTALNALLNAGLLRQYFHGDQAYDDPTRVLIATAPGGDPRTYFPVADETGSGSLSAVLDDTGALVERVLYADAYGDAPRYLQGAVADKISLEAAKDAGGTLTSMTVRVHLSERVEATSLESGARLATVKADQTLAQLTTVAPDLEDPYTIRWSLSAAEWSTLAAAPEAMSLEVSLTSALRNQGWATTPPMEIPAWARTIFSGADAKAEQPVIYRESLAAINSFTTATGSGASASRTLYAIPSLYLGANEESRSKLLTGFKAAPFVEPATGLENFRNRWYDPSTGTWLTPDAIGSTDSPNLYAYCVNDPVNCSDPSGMFGIGPVQQYVMGRLGEKYATDPGFAADADAVADVTMQVVTSPAFQGTMQIAGGCGEAALGATAIPGSAGLAAVPAFVAFFHGLDVCGAGLRTLWTGEVQESYTKQGAEAGLVALGVDPKTADVASTYIDLGISAYGTIGSSRALLGLGRRTAMVGIGATDDPITYGAAYRQSAALTNDELVQEIARRAQRKIGGWGSSRGSQKHGYAAKVLRRYQNLYGSRDMVAEVSYLHQVRVPYGTKGGIRIDVLDLNANVAHDYKFVMPWLRTGRLSRRQLRMIWTHGPQGVAVASPIYP
jgi:RHS repeat-associated protein